MPANATAALAPNTEIALSLLQIVALLLPLAGIFFQVVLTSAQSETLPDLENVTTAIGAAIASLILAGMFAAIHLALSGITILLGFAILYLAGALFAVGGATFIVDNALTTPRYTSATRRVGPPGYTHPDHPPEYPPLDDLADEDDTAE